MSEKSLSIRNLGLQTLNDIFGKYGFDSGFSTDSDSAHKHLKIICDAAREFNFEMLEIDKRFLSLFHNLGAGDFDAAYLYDTRFNPIALNGGPKLENITGLAIDLTQLLSANNLIVFYGNDRFAIPALSLYNGGKLIRQSTNAGNEIYHPDYWAADEKRYVKRARRDSGNLVELGIKSVP